MPTTDCKPQLGFDFHPQGVVQVAFDAPRMSSDGGLLLLRQAEARTGLIASIAACIPDDRDASRVHHTREEQLRQRVFSIAMGYEDCNDATALRDDPMFKLACDRGMGDASLSSQPTLSRLENAVDGSSLRSMIDVLERAYVDGLDEGTQAIVLDVDSTDDATHGGQQLSFFHGFYDQHMYHPLLVFDGEGQLVTVLLRPGNAHGARSAQGLLVRLVRRIKARLTSVQIVVRADSAFAVPALLDRLEQLDREFGDVDYVIGLAKNSVLLRMAEEPMRHAEELHRQGRAHVRHFSCFRYAAGSWDSERHVIVKAEHSARGENPRFVVTTFHQFDPKLIYDVGYCARGQCENYIKDFKVALMADRLSCSRYVANFFRLLSHAIAYRLMLEVRRAASRVAPAVTTMQMDTMRLRLLKVAASVSQSVRRILVRLPESFPLAAVFQAVARALMPAPA